ncbi:Protein FAR1-RELATED SEQUENCE 7 [Bienertia sinuspersici]
MTGGWLQVEERKDWSGFFIAVKAGEHGKHNHELMAYPDGHRQISGLSPEAKQLFPADNPIARHVYSYQDNIRLERSDGRNPVQQVLHEVVQRRNILGESVQLYAIVTDRDLELTKALAQVFPQTTHLLCTWHINKDVANRAQKLYGDRTSKMGESFKNGKWRLVMNAATQEEFDHAWTSLDVFGVISWQAQYNVNKLPFQLLNGLVSHHCLQLLLEEDKRRQGLSNDLADRCGCALRTIHGLPYACAIHVHLRLNTGIYLQEVHDFWRQLVIGERVVSGASRFIQSQLKPEDSDVQDPPVNTNVQGRPWNSSTHREASVWEYTQQGQGRGGRVSSSTGLTMYSGSVSGEMETYVFFYRHLLPAIIFDTIAAWNDVVGDGNRGFWCVTDRFHGEQENWRLVHRFIGNEIGANTFYQHVYWNGLDAPRRQIEWGVDACTKAHYMEEPSDLWAISNL